jgi:predicted flap endonuclease-1-like 5' DNA nuclease
LTDDVLADIIQAKSFQHVDFGSIRASAQEWAMNTNTVNQVWDGTEPDDFEVLPGIGELYERRLYNAGICTYEALAAMSVERLAEICQAPRMRTPDYGAWIVEARALAAEKEGDES